MYYKVVSRTLNDKLVSMASLPRSLLVEYIPGVETKHKYPLFIFDSLEGATTYCIDESKEVWEVSASGVRKPVGVINLLWLYNEDLVDDFWKGELQDNWKHVITDPPEGTLICDSIVLEERA